MDCKVVQELTSLYIDGELDGEEARQLEEHIESCPGCRQRFEEMRAIVQMVGAFEEEELPDGFMDRLYARLEAEQLIGMMRKGHHRFSGWIKWVGIAAAAAIIILAIRVLGPDGMPYTYPQEKGQSDSTATGDMPESLMADSQDEGVAAPSDASVDIAENQHVLDGGEVRASSTKSENSQQAQGADGYIKSDKVELKVQDVCVTPQTLMIRALQHGMDMVDQTENSITLRVTSIEQREALYRELELLGVVEEVGTDFESDTVTIVIVGRE